MTRNPYIAFWCGYNTECLPDGRVMCTPVAWWRRWARILRYRVGSVWS